MDKAVIYARYSSDNQTEQSIEGQLRVCKEYALKNKIQIVDTYIDRAMTGTNDHRPDFQKMIADSAKKQWKYVLVYKLDRFSRDRYEMTIHKHALKVNGVKILSAMENIPDSPEGIILESLLEGMNQYYSEELSQKTKRGMRELRIKGIFQGGLLPFGYTTKDRKIVADKEEAEIVKNIFTQYNQGHKMSDIANYLNNLNIKTKNGKTFTTKTISYMLKNEKYIGKYEKDGEIYENMYPQLIKEDLFKKVQTKNNTFKKSEVVKKVNYLLTGKVFCGYCNSTIHGVSGTSRDKTVHRYYKCKGRSTGNGCNKKPINQEDFEKIVIDTIIRLLNSPENREYIVYKILQIQNSVQISNDLNYLESQKEEINRKISNLMKFIEDGIYNDETKKRLKELTNQKEQIKDKLIDLNKQSNVILNEEDINKYLNITLKLKPIELINTFLNKIILYDDKIEIYINSPIPTNKIGNDDIPKDKILEGFNIEKNEEILLSNNEKIKISTNMI